MLAHRFKNKVNKNGLIYGGNRKEEMLHPYPALNRDPKLKQSTNPEFCLPSWRSACDLLYHGQNRDVSEILRNLIGLFRGFETKKTDFSREIKIPDLGSTRNTNVPWFLKYFQLLNMLFYLSILVHRCDRQISILGIKSIHIGWYLNNTHCYYTSTTTKSMARYVLD